VQYNQETISTCCVFHCGFLFNLLINPEVGSDWFLRNVGWLSPDWIVTSQKTILQSLLWELQSSIRTYCSPVSSRLDYTLDSKGKEVACTARRYENAAVAASKAKWWTWGSTSSLPCVTLSRPKILWHAA
jgi:hypothetical protein